MNLVYVILDACLFYNLSFLHFGLEFEYSLLHLVTHLIMMSSLII